MAALTACAGVLLIALVVTEVFSDLFHPTNSGALSDWIGRHLFNLLRRTRSMLPLAGPLAMVTTIAVWTVLLVIGFALVFYGSVPLGFRTSTGAVPPSDHRFGTALYLSAQTLTTLAFGDIVGNTLSMRVAATLEGLIGFAVVTASVSSIVLIYPALSRMRLLARGVQHLTDAAGRTGVSVTDDGGEVLLANLARDVTNTRIDLIHFPLIYYFASHEPRAALAFAVDDLVRLSRKGMASDRTPMVRLTATALDHALNDLARALAKRFLDMPHDDRDAVFGAFARDHAIERRVE